MIPQKRHAMPASSILIDWLRSPGRAWWHRTTAAMPAEASNDSQPSLDEPAAVDIDLALLESLAGLHRRQEAIAAAETPRRELADGWRTRPNVRFVGPADGDLPVLVPGLVDDLRR